VYAAKAADPNWQDPGNGIAPAHDLKLFVDPDQHEFEWKGSYICDPLRTAYVQIRKTRRLYEQLEQQLKKLAAKYPSNKVSYVRMAA
jgi:hypothetical protein